MPEVLPGHLDGVCLGIWMGFCPGIWIGVFARASIWMGFCRGIDLDMGFCPGTWMGHLDGVFGAVKLKFQ